MHLSSKSRVCHAAALAACLLLALGGDAFPVTNSHDFGGSKFFPDNDTCLYIDTLDFFYLTQGAGDAKSKMSSDGSIITLKDQQFVRGVGTQAPSEFSILLNGAATLFTATVGIDDETKGKGSAAFEVWVDGALKAKTKPLHGGDEPEEISVDLTDARRMTLLVVETDEGTDNAHADWADAKIMLKDAKVAKPVATGIPAEPPVPMHKTDPSTLAINGARVTGATPGKPFHFLIPATGKAPLKYACQDLPEGLSLDREKGIISGSLKKEGQFQVTLKVSDSTGEAQRQLTIYSGTAKLAMTPPMGWNSWNVFAAEIDRERIKDAADRMISSGLSAHGYQYINIDDGWEGTRDERGMLLPNEKFQDMKWLADYVHGKGLKLGIYSSPGPKTCQGLEGSYRHEEDDARSYADWGIDYLKYDLCSFQKLIPERTETYIKPAYEKMGNALKKVNRDIVYSLCEYGWGDVWKWGTTVGGNLWRTTGDIGDAWGTMTRLGFGESEHARYAGPGHWNDPDMLVVGELGQGWGTENHPSRLTPNEQVTHITLWCMAAAPLLIGCNLSRLDSFTTDLLTNDEVLSIDQDPLGKAGERRQRDKLLEVWSRPLFDGTTAVALFNRSIHRRQVTANWSRLGLTGRQRVRDLWAQRDLGDFDQSFTAEVPAHGAMLLKMSNSAASR